MQLIHIFLVVFNMYVKHLNGEILVAWDLARKKKMTREVSENIILRSFVNCSNWKYYRSGIFLIIDLGCDNKTAFACNYLIKYFACLSTHIEKRNWFKTNFVNKSKFETPLFYPNIFKLLKHLCRNVTVTNCTIKLRKLRQAV